MKQIWVLILCAIVFVFVVVYSVSGQEQTPEVNTWRRGDGAWCVTDYRTDGPHTECQCACEDLCDPLPTEEEVNPTKASTARPDSTDRPGPTQSPKPTDKPGPTATPTDKPEPTDKPSITPTAIPTDKPTDEPTLIPTDKPTLTSTPVPTDKPTPIPTDKPKPTTLPTVIPTQDNSCYQWICHFPGTPAEQDYCCDSAGCVRAHLAPPQNGYLGKCKP